MLSIETAPDSSQRHLERARAAFGFVPNMLGMLANAPAALETYLTVMGIFQRSSLTSVEQQVVLLAGRKRSIAARRTPSPNRVLVRCSPWMVPIMSHESRVLVRELTSSDR